MNQTDAFALVTEAVKELGFERINPESLTTLLASTMPPKGWKSPELESAYHTVMADLRAMLAPQRWHRDPADIHEELEWTNADKHEARREAKWLRGENAALRAERDDLHAKFIKAAGEHCAAVAQCNQLRAAITKVQQRVTEYNEGLNDPRGDGTGDDARPPTGDDYNNLLDIVNRLDGEVE